MARVAALDPDLVVAGLAAGVLPSVPARIRSRIQELAFKPIWQTRHGMPLKCIIAILIHCVFVYLLDPPLLYRVYYSRFIATLLVGCVVWLISTVTDRGFEYAVHETRTQHKGGESILIIMQRITRILLVIVALVVALALFGLNVTTTLAGLGIGGLAVALAAQKTLENLIGGLSLLMDKAVHVGDFCRIGDQLGTVEDVGLRSLKLRTLDQTLLIVPNGSLAQMQFGNMTGRRKLLINQTFALRIETEVETITFRGAGSGAAHAAPASFDRNRIFESSSNKFCGRRFRLGTGRLCPDWRLGTIHCNSPRRHTEDS